MFPLVCAYKDSVSVHGGSICILCLPAPLWHSQNYPCCKTCWSLSFFSFQSNTPSGQSGCLPDFKTMKLFHTYNIEILCWADKFLVNNQTWSLIACVLQSPPGREQKKKISSTYINQRYIEGNKKYALGVVVENNRKKQGQTSLSMSQEPHKGSSSGYSGNLKTDLQKAIAVEKTNNKASEIFQTRHNSELNQDSDNREIFECRNNKNLQIDFMHGLSIGKDL